MYRLYLDGKLFYDPRNPVLALTDLTCEQEINRTGSLKFTIPALHPQMEEVRKMQSELFLFQDDEWIYSGRVLSEEYDFFGNRTFVFS